MDGPDADDVAVREHEPALRVHHEARGLRRLLQGESVRERRNTAKERLQEGPHDGMGERCLIPLRITIGVLEHVVHGSPLAAELKRF